MIDGRELNKALNVIDERDSAGEVRAILVELRNLRQKQNELSTRLAEAKTKLLHDVMVDVVRIVPTLPARVTGDQIIFYADSNALTLSPNLTEGRWSYGGNLADRFENEVGQINFDLDSPKRIAAFFQNK